MISFKDKQVEKIIKLLECLNQKENLAELDDFISDVKNKYREQKMMTPRETGEMVHWALEKLNDKSS